MGPPIKYLRLKEISSQSKSLVINERLDDRKILILNQKPFHELEKALASDLA